MRAVHHMHQTQYADPVASNPVGFKPAVTRNSLPVGKQRTSRQCRLQVHASKISSALATQSSANTQPSREALALFTQQALSNGVRFGGIRAVTGSSSEGAGLYASAPIQPGQTLLSCPQKLAISSDQGLPSGIPAEAVTKWWGRLAIALLSLPRNDWRLSVLPPVVDLPATWPDEDVQQLQCPTIITQVRQERSEWQQLASATGPWLKSRVLTEQDLFYALCLVRSRSFEAPRFTVPASLKLGLAGALQLGVLATALTGGPWVPAEILALAVPAGLSWWDIQQASQRTHHVMAPFVDLFNHSAASKTEVGFDWLREALTVVSTQAHQPGQQVLISYGELSNDALLQRYGFVEKSNPHERYIVNDLGHHVLAVLLKAAPPMSLDAQSAMEKELSLRASLKQVAIDAQGNLPPDVLESVSQVVNKVIRATQQQGLSGRQVLHEALQRELSQLGTALEDDEAELQKLSWLVARAAELRARPPAPPKPKAADGVAAAAAAAAADSSNNNGVSPGLYDAASALPTAAEGVPAYAAGARAAVEQLSTTSAAVTQQVMVAPPEEQQGEAAVQLGQLVKQQGQIDNEQQQDVIQQAAMEEEEEEEEQLSPEDEAALALDIRAAARHQLCLAYRIGKKQLLVAAMKKLT